MTPLETVFEKTLPALLRKTRAKSAGSVSFVATGALETGAWTVSLVDGTVARGNTGDTVVEADAAVLALLFAGGLDVAAAVERGVVRVAGDKSRLFDLARAAGAV
jgi:hypothetical protein